MKKKKEGGENYGSLHLLPSSSRENPKFWGLVKE